MIARWNVAAVIWAAFALGGCGAKPVSTLLHPDAALVRVRSNATEGKPAEEGLGFFASPDGIVVTCARVVHGAQAVTVVAPDGSTLAARVLQEDADAGVAILKVAGKNLPSLALFDGDIAPGMHVRMLGEGGIVHGVFDQWENFGRDVDFTARVGPGDCGAPLLADDGKVMGIVLGHFEGRPTSSRAAPVWRVLQMMPNLRTPQPAS
ncbi:MAG TPA: serine protease [Tepidisphaeraceae bacterium]|jgi:S1-C subfamily serine protease|nr:serine protease [Tepidisphaeraceae bacterium]